MDKDKLDYSSYSDNTGTVIPNLSDIANIDFSEFDSILDSLEDRFPSTSPEDDFNKQVVNFTTIKPFDPNLLPDLGSIDGENGLLDDFGLGDDDFSFSSDDLDKIFPPGNDTKDHLKKLLEEITHDFTSDGESDKTSAAYYIITILFVIFICIGVIGNIVILVGIVSKKVMRTARNYFIVILAMSDLLLCLLSMPLTWWDGFSRRWPFGKDLEWLCKLAHSCQSIPVFMSSMAIVAIAADRYRCIMQPERPPFSTNFALVLSFFLAFLATGLTVPLFATARLHHFIKFPDMMNMEDIVICQTSWSGESKMIYTITMCVCQFLLPLMAVIVIYVCIYLKLKKRPRSQHAENENRRRRANIMIVSIAATFFTLWLPLYIFSFLVELQADLIRPIIEGYETIIYAALNLFGLCTACINPVLYGYFNENFRKEYKHLYRKMPWYSSTDAHPALHLQIMSQHRRSCPKQQTSACQNGRLQQVAGASADQQCTTSILPQIKDKDAQGDEKQRLLGEKDQTGDDKKAVENGNGKFGQTEELASVLVEQVPKLHGEDYRKPCLILTTHHTPGSNLSEAAMLTSISQAARDKTLCWTMPLSSETEANGTQGQENKVRHRLKRQMTLPGIGEVQVTKAVITHEHNETKLQKITEENKGLLDSEDVDDFHVVLFTNNSEDTINPSKSHCNGLNSRASSFKKRFMSMRHMNGQQRRKRKKSLSFMDNSNASMSQQSLTISNGITPKVSPNHEALDRSSAKRQRSLPALLRSGISIHRQELPVLRMVDERLKDKGPRSIVQSHQLSIQHPVNFDDLEETAV